MIPKAWGTKVKIDNGTTSNLKSYTEKETINKVNMQW
jgi:hypothetical protein